MAKKRKKIPSLTYQISSKFDGMMRIGESRHEAKKNGDTSGIYSYNTRKTYLNRTLEFAKWTKENFGVKEVDLMEPYIQDYFNHLKENGASAWTQNTSLAALSKFYQKPLFQEIKIDKRERSEIKRSREAVDNDGHFSLTKNAELIEFCCSTGLRRRELENIKGSDLVEEDGRYYIHVRNGKGGKERFVPVLNNNPLVVSKMRSVEPSQRVWGKVHSKADIHGYRSVYASECYKSLERDLNTLDRKEIYFCRKDKAGIKYDRRALLITSRYLGHNRVDVIATNYLNGV